MSPNSKKIDKRVTRTKEALKESLIGLLGEKELNAITITEITARVNFNRGTFYAHYTKKEDLLDEIIAEVINDLTESFRATYRGKESIDLQKLSSSDVHVFDHIAEHEHVYRILLNPTIMPEFLGDVVNGLTEAFLKDFSYEDCSPSLDLELHVQSRVYAILGIILYWAKQDFKYSPRYIADQMLLTFTYTPHTFMSK